MRSSVRSTISSTLRANGGGRISRRVRLHGATSASIAIAVVAWARGRQRHMPLVVPTTLLTALLAGCAQVPNQWVEDGPATASEWQSPTAQDVQARYAAAPLRQRGWEKATAPGESDAVQHWPLYFEDPFVDKGHGRQGLNKYHVGWEDYVALPYGYSRFTLNWLMFPVSAVVTPPWTLMESDGRLSRQALGYDHDAARAGAASRPPAEAGDEAGASSAE